MLLIAGVVVVRVSLTLPVHPVGSPLFKVGMGPNPDMGETVGWNGYIHTVSTVAAAIPAGQIQHTIVLASNYGEAGALYLARRGDHPAAHLPPVYSGHNAFWSSGPPPESATNVIMVCDFSTIQLRSWYAGCTLRARLHSRPGVDNDEGGEPVCWCTGRTRTWTHLRPQVQHSADATCTNQPADVGNDDLGPCRMRILTGMGSMPHGDRRTDT